MKIGKGAGGAPGPTEAGSIAPQIETLLQEAPKKVAPGELLVDLEKYARLLLTPTSKKLPPSFARIASTSRVATPPSAKAAAKHVVARASGALETLAGIYADGKPSTAELLSLSRAVASLRDILALAKDPSLDVLPSAVRHRLEQKLFTPLSSLSLLASVDQTQLQLEADKAQSAAEAAEAGAVDSSSASGTIIRAGGAQTPSIVVIERSSAEGALSTTRGPTLGRHGVEYASYNEDAAVLTVAESAHGDVWVAGAFDQAGGMGHIPGQTGAASKIAAEHLDSVAASVAAGASPKQALRKAVRGADKELIALNEEHGVEAITTVASGVIVNDRAYVVNVGDSQVYHYDVHGKLKNMTRPHNLGDEMARETGNPNAGLKVANIVTSALGIYDEKPMIDLYEWKLKPGDYLVFTSDGVSDASYLAQVAAKKAKKPWTKTGGDQVAEDLGKILSKGPSAKDATAKIRSYALSQMKNELGKPDNTTVVVFQKK